MICFNYHNPLFRNPHSQQHFEFSLSIYWIIHWSFRFLMRPCSSTRTIALYTVMPYLEFSTGVPDFRQDWQYPVLQDSQEVCVLSQDVEEAADPVLVVEGHALHGEGCQQEGDKLTQNLLIPGLPQPFLSHHLTTVTSPYLTLRSLQ